MLKYDPSFGISQEEFNEHYGYLSKMRFSILKHQLYSFLYFISDMYKNNSNENIKNKSIIISKNHLHNVVQLMIDGLNKLSLHSCDDIKKFIKKITKKGNPLYFQKYILTTRKWPCQNTDRIKSIRDFLDKNGPLELDNVKTLIAMLQDVSLTEDQLNSFLKSLEPVNL